jgi:hypothetical protein
VKDTGEPEQLGEVLYQAGATATAVHDENGNLAWEVRRHRDGMVRTTKKLAHTSHWEPEDRWKVGS